MEKDNLQMERNENRSDELADVEVWRAENVLTSPEDRAEFEGFQEGSDDWDYNRNET